MTSTLTINEHVSLTQFNTLGLEAQARYFGRIHSLDQLREALLFARKKGLPVIPLGGGSNVVLSSHLDAVVLAIEIKGSNILERNEHQVLVQAGAGENWHEFVLWTLGQNAFGLENLSLIPGTVGAAPIQNIGAYGVELKDHFVALEAVSVTTGELRQFNAVDCTFGYRDSVFKGALRDQYIITSVTLTLDASLQPKLGYGHLKTLLQQRLGDAVPTGMDISEAVSDIRQEKLPDPKDIGNAGSFFKNPLVSLEKVECLKQEYPELVAYPAGDRWKLAAGWLIDKAGLRGVRHGAVGTYQHQALVLVNHGQASGADVLEFSARVQQQVLDKFGVQLEPEPRVY